MLAPITGPISSACWHDGRWRRQPEPATASPSQRPGGHRRYSGLFLVRGQVMSRIGQVLAVTAAVLLALVLLALLLTPVFIERTIRAELAKRGVNTVAMDMSVPGLTGSTVRSVRIGRDGAFTADEIAVRYHITDLIHGRIDGIRLLRPRLHLSVTSD